MPKKPPTRIRNKTGQSTKQQITRAALECYTRLGPARTTNVDIAKRAGVPPPLVLYYFPGPDALFSEVIQHILEGLREEVLGAIQANVTNPRKALLAYVSAHLQWAARHEELLGIWLYFYYLATVNPHFRELNSAVRETGRERIAALIYEGMAKGHFEIPKSHDVPALAREIQLLINGGWVMPFTEKHCPLGTLITDIEARVESILSP
jgi:AcrR family transcriptional regulator